ncbi:MAG: hypothetical protein R3B95_19450 [Nitrospirales bacterium]|nr:hypothetical protein [Nitrospirales bacterium]
MTTPLSNISTFYNQFLTSVMPKRATLLVIVVLGLLGGMGWVHVTEKEQYLIQRNFRLLNLWGQDLSQKIQSYQKVFEVGASGIQENLNPKSESKSKLSPVTPNDGRNLSIRTREKDKPQPKKVPNNRVAKQGPQGELISVDCDPDSQPNKSPSGSVPTGDRIQTQAENVKYQLRRMCEAEGLTKIQAQIKKPQSEKPGLEVISNQLHPLIQITYSADPATSSDPATAIEIIGKVNLGSFLQRLTNRGTFSEVLLFALPHTPSQSATLLFQSDFKEFSWDDLSERAQPVTSQSWLGNLLGQNLSSPHSEVKVNLPIADNHFLFQVPGQSYHGFSHPIPIPGTANQKWVLVGLVEDATFTNNTLAISSTLLLGVMIGFLGIVIAIPLFHLKVLNPTDPLRLTHIMGLVLSALLGTGLVTFLALDTTIYWEGKQAFQHHLEESAQTIKNRFSAELLSVLSTLKQFDHSDYVQKDFHEVALPPSKNLNKIGERPVLLDGHIPKGCDPKRMVPVQPHQSKITSVGLCPPENISHAPEQPWYYGDFLYAFWMDPDGSLRINWARDTFHGKPVQGMTDNIALRGRQYVSAVTQHPTQLWQWPIFSPEGPLQQPYSFFLEPIISWTTGFNTVVASMPSSLGQHESQENWVAAIEFKFVSLMDNLVLPPGTGFAVIDEKDHRVLFHSEQGRNLREKFLIETDENPALQDLLSARTAGHAEGSYWGKPTSFYLLPLSPVPWSLVVFREMEILRSVNLVGLLVAGSLYGLWSLIVYWLLWIMLKGQNRHRKFSWLWPNIGNHNFYRIILIHNLGWFLLGMIGIFLRAGNPGEQLSIGLLVPMLCVGGIIALTMKHCQRPSLLTTNQAQSFFPNQKISLLAFPYSYSLMLTSGLLLLGVIPAYGCFSSVFNQEITLFSQYQLLETFKSFQASGKIPIPRSKWEPSASINTVSLNAVDLPENCAKEAAPSTATPDTVSQYSLGLYPDFFLKTSWNLCPKGSLPREEGHGLFERGFALLSQPFSPLLKHVSLWGFVGDSWPLAKDYIQDIHWGKNNGTASLYFRLEGTSVGSNQGVPLTFLRLGGNIGLSPWFLNGKLPSISNLTLEKFLGYLLVIGFVGFWLLKVPKFIADRALFLSYSVPTTSTLSTLFPRESPELMTNRLLIGFPGQGKTAFLATQLQASNMNHPSVLYFDLKAHSPDQWQAALMTGVQEKYRQNIQSIHVIIDHLDYQWKDPDINKQKLDFLEFFFNVPSRLFDQRHVGKQEKQPLVAEILGKGQPSTVTTKIPPPA